MLKLLIFTQLLIYVPNAKSHPTRERHESSKIDPYAIARMKCDEYARARYRPSTTERIMDCHPSTPLITFGTDAKLKEFPHMAVIGYPDVEDVRKMEWYCGGSLISEGYVLTAAHCEIEAPLPAKWVVRLGELIIDDERDGATPQDISIKQFIKHPRYKEEFVYHDIALIKLEETVEFTPYIRPICLYTSSILTKDSRTNAIVTGWGLNESRIPSKALQKAKIHVHDDSICALKTRYVGDRDLPSGYKGTIMICAGDENNGNDTCEGDSGGPLQVPTNTDCMYWQVGITSYGSGECNSKSKPAIYTRVYAYIPWIQNIVWPVNSVN